MKGQDRSPGLLAVAGALNSAAVLAIIAGLFIYSLSAAVEGSPDSDRQSASLSTPTREPVQSAQATVRATVRPNFQFFIFVLCDGETVKATIYDGIIYGESVTLSHSQDHGLIVALLEGTETAFPQRARLFGSACMRERFPSPKWS